MHAPPTHWTTDLFLQGAALRGGHTSRGTGLEERNFQSHPFRFHPQPKRNITVCHLHGSETKKPEPGGYPSWTMARLLLGPISIAAGASYISGAPCPRLCPAEADICPSPAVAPGLAYSQPKRLASGKVT